jgi:hypothetical protein
VATVSRHLDAYVESFLAIDRFGGRFTPRDVMTTRTSRQFQFGGPDAPSLAPILGTGACFVLRELVRMRLVTRDDVHPYCYAPVRRIRQFLAPLGSQDDENGTAYDRSRSIHEFVSEHHPDDPTFGNAFDIPLLMYLEEFPDPFPTGPTASHDGDFITLTAYTAEADTQRADFWKGNELQRVLDAAAGHAHTRCRGSEHLRQELACVEALSGEGLMLRQPESRYEAGRSSTLLKVKAFHDAEARVVGHEPGAGRHKGRLGACWSRWPTLPASPSARASATLSAPTRHR